jgi:hypothetical protein
MSEACMTRKLYIGVGDLAKRVRSIYAGVDGVSRRVTRAYIGVDGATRRFYYIVPEGFYQQENEYLRIQARISIDSHTVSVTANFFSKITLPVGYGQGLDVLRIEVDDQILALGALVINEPNIVFFVVPVDGQPYPAGTLTMDYSDGVLIMTLNSNFSATYAAGSVFTASGTMVV